MARKHGIVCRPLDRICGQKCKSVLNRLLRKSWRRSALLSVLKYASAGLPLAKIRSRRLFNTL